MVRVLCETGGDKNNWKFSTFNDLKKELKGKSKAAYLKTLDAVDVLTLGCKTDPIPPRDIQDETFDKYGHYRGSWAIIDSVLKDVIDVPFYNATGKNLGTQSVCRWAYIPINEKRVASYFDRKEQDFREHGYAACKNVEGEKFTPSVEF